MDEKGEWDNVREVAPEPEAADIVWNEFVSFLICKTFFMKMKCKT